MRKSKFLFAYYQIDYAVGMELLIRDFNILRIVKALHDLEKIKDLILNDTEIEIFDNLPQPIILTNSKKNLSIS